MPTKTKSYANADSVAKALKKLEKGEFGGMKIEDSEQAKELGVSPDTVGRWVILEAASIAEYAVNQKEDEPNFTPPAQMDEEAAYEIVNVVPVEGGSEIEYANGDKEIVGDDMLPGVPTVNSLLANRAESTVEHPVKFVHALVTKMYDDATAAGQPEPRRKDIMKAAQDAGVAFYTARTQIQIALKNRNGVRAQQLVS